MAFDPINAPRDYILLAQQKSPGFADISGASSIRNWDEVKGYGISGGYSKFVGRGLAHFSVKLRFYTPSDWADWADWKPIVDKLPTKRSGSGKDSGNLDIFHPILADLKIRAVGVAEILQPEQTDHGEWTVEIKFIEFRRPEFTLAKPEGAAATPVDPIEDGIIKPLINQVQALAGVP